MKYDKETIIEKILSFEEGKKVLSPCDMFIYLSDYMDKEQEYFLCMTLDSAQQLIDIHEVTKGLVNKAMIHPREVFRHALFDNAVSIIVAHNHPSGCLEPSPEDLYATSQLKRAAEIMGIKLLDHMIISKRGYYSLVEAGEFSEID